MINILGIDPGTQAMGWGSLEVDGRKVKYLASGVFYTKGKDRVAKLVQIFNFVQGLIEKHKPRIVSVENTFFGKNVQSMIKLGEARSAAVLAAALSGVDVATFAPKEIKMSLVGNGNASKEQVAFMVKRVLDIEGDPPFDETDALAAAYCWAQRSLKAR